MDKELILETLLRLDDPFYLNTFANAVDEDEWFRINERYIQTDLQRYFPASISTTDPATWQFIKSKLKQFSVE
ncbi:hypothetical protein D1831_13835 [Lactiplantibacillus garii]|uniref:Uncharacterized protein n=1 Tax=Lactiplantibacillus garii TaxID=2306423 RepID=A0A426D3U5_9LACO|nr:hypothetical protein [Lactiplantibacillus garii]RRK09238.1 hypothetical protein D1831_13835 [Lactiplantibacillus garii]